MTIGPRTVFVLGAGFTRAFLTKAPLLVDDYDPDPHHLEKEFVHYRNARKILDLEKERNLDRKIDIERLMTRLDGGMPYDLKQGAEDELLLLLKRVKKSFMDKLHEAREKDFHKEELAELAKYCILNGVNCITFNYDDVFDQALWEVRREVMFPSSEPYWHPDGGYGYFCRPSEVCIQDVNVYMDRTSMLLLKLHGSVNWRIRLGASSPFMIESVVHHEDWTPSRTARDIPVEYLSTESIEDHLEPEPFMVPPVLVKSELTQQPVLRLVWSLAYEKLLGASQIIFLGYSLPITDLAASFLFSEAIIRLGEVAPLIPIRVVNFAEEDSQKNKIKETYRKLFPNLDDNDFDFRGVLEWSKELIAAESGGS